MVGDQVYSRVELNSKNTKLYLRLQLGNVNELSNDPDEFLLEPNGICGIRVL